MMQNTARASNKGFSLVEMLIALGLATVLTLLMASMAKPWLDMRNRLETESRLATMGKALEDMYDLAAFSMETPPPDLAGVPGWMALGSGGGNMLYGFVGSERPIGLAGDNEKLSAFMYSEGGALSTQIPLPCDTNLTLAFWRHQASMLGMSPEKTARDADGGTFCLVVGPTRLASQGSISLPYRQLYVVSPGKNARWDSGSAIDVDAGGLLLRGDDMGIAVSGLPIQLAKFKVTQTRLQRAASLYERYFSMRYLSSNTRDVAKNYFADPDGVVPTATLGYAYLTRDYEYLRADLSLAPLGVVGQDALNAWELPLYDLGVTVSNAIYMANHVDGDPSTPDEQEVRSPAGNASPPYSASLFTFLPGMQTYGVHAYGRY